MRFWRPSWPVLRSLTSRRLKAVDLLRARIAGQLKAAHRLCGVDGIPGLLLDCFAAAPHTGLTRQQLRVHLHVNGAARNGRPRRLVRRGFSVPAKTVP